MKTYSSTQEIYRSKIRVDKKDSVFTYFTLEAMENMCFYSTIQHELGQRFRDIVIHGTIEFKDEIKRVLEVLAQKFPVEILSEEVFVDSKNN